jgi:sortase A
VLRFAGAVLAMSGFLLLADVAATLLWQEPVSAYLASRSQDTLERRLNAETQRYSRSVKTRAAARPDPRRAIARAARSFRARLGKGDAFGRVAMPTLGQSYVVAEDTDVPTLRTGPGHYTDSGVPGLHKTVALAGHRTTYGAPFSDVDELESGDPIVVTMPYGRFTYRVQRTRIVDPSAYWVTQRGRDRLVLTSCHPPFSAAQRIVVFARLATQRGAQRGGASSSVHLPTAGGS